MRGGAACAAPARCPRALSPRVARTRARTNLAIERSRCARSCANGRLPRVIELLDWKSEIEAKDARGWSPLYYAAEFGHTETVVELLRRGA